MTNATHTYARFDGQRVPCRIVSGTWQVRECDENGHPVGTGVVSVDNGVRLVSVRPDQLNPIQR